MSYKLLIQILNFDVEKNRFSKQEQIHIEKAFRKQTNQALNKISKKVIASIDYINDH